MLLSLKHVLYTHDSSKLLSQVERSIGSATEPGRPKSSVATEPRGRRWQRRWRAKSGTSARVPRPMRTIKRRRKERKRERRRIRASSVIISYIATFVRQHDNMIAGAYAGREGEKRVREGLASAAGHNLVFRCYLKFLNP